MRAAAHSLGIKRSTVSHQLKALEGQLGTALFVRTTRSINLTEAGRALLRASGPAFEQLADGLESARSAGHTARGVLKLAVPDLAYRLLLCNHLGSFNEHYPDIEVELSLTDALSDILEEGLHAGFRLGGFIAEDMVAINLSHNLNTAVVASPKYLDLHGRPEQPMDLLNHNCLRYRYQSSSQLAPWRFTGDEGVYAVEARGPIVANSVPVTLDMAIQGLGLAYTFGEYCSEALEMGQLEEVLGEFKVSMPGIHIYFPKEYRDYMPLRLFIDHIRQQVQNNAN